VVGKRRISAIRRPDPKLKAPDSAEETFSLFKSRNYKFCVSVGLTRSTFKWVGWLRRVRFYVPRGLAVPCILGCNFINIHVKAILTKEQKVLLQEGCIVAFRLALGRSNVVRPSLPGSHRPHHSPN
jgi:hypothetical protein